MTSNPRPASKPCCALPFGTRALAVSLAATLLLGWLTLVQSAPSAATVAPPSDAAARLDAGVDWGHVEAAPEPAGASLAACER